MIHFEELWEKCEQLHQESINEGTASDIINELMMKFNIYKVIDSKTEIPLEERQKIKSRTLGEILLTLTNLSLKDNINVYESLSTAYKYRSIEHYATKYPT